MKTNSILLATIGFAFLMLTSCRPENLGYLIGNSQCEGGEVAEHLGDLEFMGSTLNMVPNNEASLVFRNEAGDEIKFEIDSQIENDVKLNIDHICGDVYTYYDAIRAEETYIDEQENKISFTRSMHGVEYSPEEFLLYDQIQLLVRLKDTSFGIIKIGIPRDNEGDFPRDFLDGMNEYEVQRYLELGGVQYEKVYSSLESQWSNGKIYMTPENGVIGLLDKDDVFWKLQ